MQDLYFRNCLALLILFIMNCFLVVIPENHLKLSHEYFKTLASSGGFFHHLSESSEPQATLQSFFSTIEQSFCAVRASDVGDKVVGQQRKLRPVKSARSVERLGSEQADKCSSGLTCQPVVSAVVVGESGLPHNTTSMRDNDAKRRNSALAESLTGAASADGAKQSRQLVQSERGAVGNRVQTAMA